MIAFQVVLDQQRRPIADLRREATFCGTAYSFETFELAELRFRWTLSGYEFGLSKRDQQRLPAIGMTGPTVATGETKGRPLGVQLIGARYREDILLAAGRDIEAAGRPVVVANPD